jgi:hypothetical protein
VGKPEERNHLEHLDIEKYDSKMYFKEIGWEGG